MITFEDKVTNTAVETSLSAIPVTQKISAGDINQIQTAEYLKLTKVRIMALQLFRGVT
jgi:hypothetical protein